MSQRIRNLAKMCKQLWSPEAGGDSAEASDLERRPFVGLMENRAESNPAESPQPRKSKCRSFWWNLLLSVILYSAAILSSVAICWWGYMTLAVWDMGAIDEWEMRWDPSFMRQNAQADCRVAFPGLNLTFCFDKCDQYPEIMPQFCLDELVKEINATNIVTRMRVAFHNRDTVLRQALAEYALRHAHKILRANTWDLLLNNETVVHLFLYSIAATFTVVAAITTVWITALNWLCELLFCICAKNSASRTRVHPKPIWALILIPIVEIFAIYGIGWVVNMSLEEFTQPMMYLHSLNENFRLNVAPQYAPVDAFRGAFQPAPGILALPVALNKVIV